MIYLGVLSPKAMTIQIERIAASLGPSSVQLTLPLNGTKSPEMRDKIPLQNSVQLLHSPLVTKFRWNGKLLSKIFC